jgi:hypothetical protein
MTIRGKDWIYIHIPKTGGTSVINALRSPEIFGKTIYNPLVHKHGWPDRFEQSNPRVTCACAPRLDTRGITAFSFVRHPQDWYESMYWFRHDRNWAVDPRHLDPADIEVRWPVEGILTEYLNPTFSEFMHYMLENEPGYVQRLYEQYVGPPDNEIDFVGRTENLKFDLRKILIMLQYYNRITFMQVSVDNQHGKLHKTPWTQKLLDAVYDSEKGAFDRWGYKPRRLE